MSDSKHIPVGQTIIAAASLLLGLVAIIALFPDLKEFFSFSLYFRQLDPFGKVLQLIVRYAPFLYIASLIAVGIVLFFRQKVNTIAGYAGIFFVFIGFFNFIINLASFFGYVFYGVFYDLDIGRSSGLFNMIWYAIYIAIGIILLVKPHKMALTVLFGVLFLLTVYNYISGVLSRALVIESRRSMLVLMLVFAGTAAMLLASQIVKKSINAFIYIWFIPGTVYFLLRLLFLFSILKELKGYTGISRYIFQIYFVTIDGIMIFTIPLLLIGYWLLRVNEQKLQPGAAVNTVTGPRNAELLATWQNLLESGVITDAEYEAKRRQILGQ